MCNIHIIYIKVYDTEEYTILCGIIYNNMNIYILVNSVINRQLFIITNTLYKIFHLTFILRSYLYYIYLSIILYTKIKKPSKKPNNPDIYI